MSNRAYLWIVAYLFYIVVAIVYVINWFANL